MIFDIDKKNKLSTAIIDDSGNRLTYGDLTIFCDALKRKIPERKLVFCLCKNTAPSLAGFLALYDNKDVSLLLNASIEKGLLDNLYNIYKPEYIWCPSNMEGIGETEIIEEYLGYVLYRTTNDTPALNPDLSLLLTTSGTTGSPKLVRHKYDNIEAAALNISTFFHLTKEDRPLLVLPLYYTMGLSVVFSHLYVGATVLITNQSMTDRAFWSFMKEQKATSFTGVPYSFEILNLMRFFRMDLPDLKLLTQGGGKMPRQLNLKFAEYCKDNGKLWIATYGQSEGTARMAYLPAKWAVEKVGSIGVAVPNAELSLMDSDGNMIEEANIEGEMCYRGKNVTLGYACKREDLLLGDERNGFMHTGDLAYRDEDGCYYIVGRMGRFLKLFGMRIGLDECEQIIKSKFSIECACVGTDEKMIVYLTNSQYAQQVKELLIEKTKLIASVFEVRIIDELPRNEAGKILYSKFNDI